MDLNRLSIKTIHLSVIKRDGMDFKMNFIILFLNWTEANRFLVFWSGRLR